MKSGKLMHDQEIETLQAEVEHLRQQIDDLRIEKEMEVGRYRALFEQTNDAVFIISLDHVHLQCNQKAADMLGCKIEDIVGHNIRDFIVPEETTASIERGEQLLRGEQPPIYERTFLRVDGTQFPAEINLALAYDTEGNPSHWHSIVRDISERKQAEQERMALALERERVNILSSFIQDAGHEFRTPLAIMNLALYLMKKEDTEDRFVERIATIKNQIGNIEDIIKNMIVMMRLDSHMIRMAHTRLELTSLVEQSIKIYQEIAREKEIHLTLSNTISPIFIEGDFDQMSHALQRILHNAIQYTPEGGSVQVQLHDREEGVAIVVEDNGIGMEQHHLARIFERFYKADVARTSRGAGLGLSIAKKIIELNGGDISATSTPDEGSIFTITLPIVEPEGGAHPG